ncbi:alpha/beta hydrolase [Streptomyces sp. NA02950]|uniref:alpha/beta hydrolase n=1 Tax=Streptomyces sp. NA02950 TaxID=2742137 RepID=UPI0020CB65D8|nr:alpha/beta hydrolase [Streptomyces sp. NA02950]
MRSRSLAHVLAASTLAALVPALAPTTASAAENPLGQYLSQRPAWHRCGASAPASYQCATIKVPLDYGRPDGKKVNLAISRLKTSTAAERRGVLLVNPGGPGGTGVGMPLSLASELPTSVKKRYDLVGFDPRGVGESSPVSCGLTDSEQNWERPYRAEKFAKDVKWARTFAEKCDAEEGDRLRHITTRNTARDMDVIRAALGEKKISYLGYSYGTYLGAVYTQLFPRHADRFVLDSAVDPARIWRGMIQIWAEGAEPAFTRWSKWTAQRHGTYKLGRTPQAVRKTFWGLVAKADRKPIELDGRKLTGDDIRSGSRAGFFSVREGAEAIAKLKKAADRTPARTGKPKPPSRPTQPVFGRTVPDDNGNAAFWTVVCADTRAWPHDPEQYRDDAVRAKAEYPLYGDFGSTIKPCAFWKKNGSEPATTIDNKVGALILQNEWDPQTPLASGLGLHRLMKGSRMVTVAGGQGHGIYGSKSCADKRATTYLTTGGLPAKDTTCRAPAPRREDSGTKLPLPTPPGLPGMTGRF